MRHFVEQVEGESGPANKALTAAKTLPELFHLGKPVTESALMISLLMGPKISFRQRRTSSKQPAAESERGGAVGDDHLQQLVSLSNAFSL
ncbi:unnamed protein product [Camellia sinensis]